MQRDRTELRATSPLGTPPVDAKPDAVLVVAAREFLAEWDRECETHGEPFNFRLRAAVRRLREQVQ